MAIVRLEYREAGESYFLPARYRPAPQAFGPRRVKQVWVAEDLAHAYRGEGPTRRGAIKDMRPIKQ